MGMLKFLFGGSPSESTNHEAIYEVRIKTTVYVNGLRTINQWVRMNRTQMPLFTGSNKQKDAIKGWIKANSIGAKIVNRNFGTVWRRVH
jgi:hypothetical protein